MSNIDGLIRDLDERVIAQRVGKAHDDARVQYHLNSNTVDDFREFEGGIAQYYVHHLSSCVAYGGRISQEEARGRAKELLEREYRRRRGDIISAYNDAHDGTNGGMRKILDIIAEGLKSESIERYVRDQFDLHIAPNDFETKVAYVRAFFDRCGPYLSGSIQINRPERYANNYRELIEAYVEGLRETSSVFRRL